MRLRDLYNLAGILTGLRLLIAAIVPFFVHGPWLFWLYVFALFTDVIDGVVARRMGHASRAGAAWDGWVDKTLHVNLAWSLCVADRIPDWWMLLWFSRELIQGPLVPVLVHRFRVADGPRPRTSLVGRATSILLAIAVLMALRGFDATTPTIGVGVLGTLAGLGYARRHLVPFFGIEPRSAPAAETSHPVLG